MEVVLLYLEIGFWSVGWEEAETLKAIFEDFKTTWRNIYFFPHNKCVII